MNKIFNKLFLGLAVCGLAMTACSDGVEWEPSPVPTEGVQAYIYADNTDLTFKANDKQSFQLNVARQKTDEAATIHLVAEGGGATIPSTVDFAAGEDKKVVEVSFDIPIGTSSTVTVSIPEAESYVYAASQLFFTITRDYTWLSLGDWTLESSFYGGSGSTAFFKAAETNLYKAVEPYEKGYDLLFKVDGNVVTVDKQPIASSYGNYGTLSVAGSGTFENNVMTLELTFSVPEGSFGAFVEQFGNFE